MSRMEAGPSRVILSKGKKLSSQHKFHPTIRLQASQPQQNLSWSFCQESRPNSIQQLAELRYSFYLWEPPQLFAHSAGELILSSVYSACLMINDNSQIFLDVINTTCVPKVEPDWEEKQNVTSMHCDIFSSRFQVRAAFKAVSAFS